MPQVTRLKKTTITGTIYIRGLFTLINFDDLKNFNLFQIAIVAIKW